MWPYSCVGVSLPVPTSLEYGHMCLWRIVKWLSWSEATVGAKIGRLTIVEIRRIPYKLKNGVTANRPHAVCDCDCGTKSKEILVCSLGGLVVSCGCVRLRNLEKQ